MRLVIDIVKASIRVERADGFASWLDVSDAQLVDGDLRFIHTGPIVDVTGPLVLERSDGTSVLTSVLPDRIRNVRPDDTVTLNLGRDLELVP